MSSENHPSDNEAEVKVTNDVQEEPYSDLNDFEHAELLELLEEIL